MLITEMSCAPNYMGVNIMAKSVMQRLARSIENTKYLERISASVVRGDRGDAPWREVKRGATMHPASQARRAGSARRAPKCAWREVRGDRLYALIVCGAGRVTTR